MRDVSFPDALARLGCERLTTLLEARPDVLVEPVPRRLEQLAQRLGGAESLSDALETCHRDMAVAAQAVALLGTGATVPAVAALLRSSEALASAAVDELCARGLAWREGDTVALPERLAEHLRSGVGVFRPITTIAKQAVVEDVREAVHALDGAVAGQRKPELITRLGELAADAAVVRRAIAGLPAPARLHLSRVRQGHYLGSWSRRASDPDEPLLRAGLMVRVYGRGELPREVAVAAWASERDVALTGPPALPDAPAAADTDAGMDGALAAAEELLRGATALLDEARAAGIAALKKGGVGARERARLGKRLSASTEDVGFWIDLAAAAGLLAPAGARYAPTAGYDGWRDAAAGERWAALARAWWDLDFVPTHRMIDDDTEAPPPVPLVSDAGMVRRALLRAAAGGRSVEAAAVEIDWYCPLNHYDAEATAARLVAATREARALGVVVGDAVSQLGEQLVSGTGDLAALLPETRGMIVLQSDLTAVVSGQPSAPAARLLAAAAVAESRGVAVTWRFTPASVRSALDAGWSAEQLCDELRAVSDHPLPQPLDYLIVDAARRHGSVRVRGMRSCVVGSESEIAEILHTRALRTLHLAALAPTVLSCPFDVDDVLARLRAAGFAPLAEDAEGVVVVEERPETRAPAAPVRVRPRLAAAEVARRLLDAPVAEEPGSATYRELAALTSRLDSAELSLLADAVDNQRDVSIVYRDRAGNRTTRDVAPRELHGRWLDSWCHRNGGQRDFTVANIEAVGPPRQDAIIGGW